MTPPSLPQPLVALALFVAAGCAVNPTPRCALDTDCGNGARCYRGFCIEGERGDASAGCAVGRSDCGGECRDLMTDADHCGGCDVDCGEGERCALGACVPEA